MPFMKVISGGQTGADQLGLAIAKIYGIETCGYAPPGFLTEDGPAPWLADYGLIELRGEFDGRVGYPARTAANVSSSRLVLWFGDEASTGGKCTRTACVRHRVPFRSFDSKVPISEHQLAWEIECVTNELWRNPYQFGLMLAGNRDSKFSDADRSLMTKFLHGLFRQLGYTNRPTSQELT